MLMRHKSLSSLIVLGLVFASASGLSVNRGWADENATIVGALTLELDDTAISEADGLAATRGTVSRNSATAKELIVKLTNSDKTEIRIPDNVIIEKGKTESAPFDISVVDDSVMDGTQKVVITASADAHAAATKTVDVTDDDAAENAGTYAVWVLAFGAFAMFALLWYTGWKQTEFYELAKERLKLGGGGSFSGETVSMAAPTAPAAPGALAAPAPVITGPASVILGLKSPEFKVEVGGTQPASGVTWSVTPADAAAVLPSTSGATQIVAAKAGALTVSATVNGQTVSLQVAALPDTPPKMKIPFVGGGLGSFYVAIMILALAGTLGILGVLTGEGVATIIGAIAGYIFGRGKPNPEDEE